MNKQRLIKLSGNVKEKVDILGVYTAFPIIKHTCTVDGTAPNTDDVLSIMCSPYPKWSQSVPIITYRGVPFASISDIRQSGIQPKVISGSAVLCCHKTRQLIFQRRSSLSATYPNFLHIMGGSCIAPTRGNQRPHDACIAQTIQREIHEESGLMIDYNRLKTRHISITHEKTTGFIQISALGVHLTSLEIQAAADIGGSDEGRIQYVDFDNLENTLTANDVVPTCTVNVLLWLISDPLVRTQRVFAGKTGQAVFDRIIH